MDISKHFKEFLVLRDNECYSINNDIPQNSTSGTASTNMFPCVRHGRFRSDSV